MVYHTRSIIRALNDVSSCEFSAIRPLALKYCNVCNVIRPLAVDRRYAAPAPAVDRRYKSQPPLRFVADTCVGVWPRVAAQAVPVVTRGGDVHGTGPEAG